MRTLISPAVSQLSRRNSISLNYVLFFMIGELMQLICLHP